MLALPTLTPHNAILTFFLLTSIKWLLVPTYRSTDFDVHRLWLAITRHLPPSEWYFYDAHGTTKHTLDYPPLFAFFEYALSSNYITSSLLKKNGDDPLSSSWLEEECLALLPVPSYDTTTTTITAPTFPSMIMEVSDNCIRFHRGTVIISDLILFVGAYMAATAVASSTTTTTSCKPISPSSSSSSSRAAASKSASWVAFILIVTNPGLLMLDHVHFQYNGMLLGVLLISIAGMVRGAAGATSSSSSLSLQQQQQTQQTTQLPQHQRIEDYIIPSDNISAINNHNGRQQRWEIFAAATFAALLALKHLYLSLAPLYFFYLLRRHCFIAIICDDPEKDEFNDTDKNNTTRSKNSYRSSSLNNNEIRVVLRFSWRRLLVLGFVTLLCFLGPFVPFLIQSDNPAGQMQQIIKRLFPFGRGLVHDYWAANVWALYLFCSRVVAFIFQRSPVTRIVPIRIRYILDSIIPFPEPKPSLVAVILLIGLWPGGIHMAWKIGSRSLVEPLCNSYPFRGKLFVQAVVFCSMSSFMLSYHVHEKSILTAIIPMTLLAPYSRRAARLFIRMCMFGIFGIIPLLYRPEELLLKTALYIVWICGAIFILDTEEAMHCLKNDDKNHSDSSLVVGVQLERKITKRSSATLTKIDLMSFVILGIVLLFMELIHPIVFMPSGRMEFLPLMATSVVCAMGLAWCWLESYRQTRLSSDISVAET